MCLEWEGGITGKKRKDQVKDHAWRTHGQRQQGNGLNVGSDQWVEKGQSNGGRRGEGQL